MKSRVSSTVTKRTRNPRPRKYASASERQAAYRARAPEVCFRAEARTVETLDRIADTLDQSRADVLLSMTKFALANHDWARFGLTHKPLPFEYGVNPIMDDDVQRVGIFNVRYVRKGEQLGPRNKSGKTIGPAAEPVVEFYDSRYPHTERGQFVSSYYARTLNEAPWGEGLILDTGSPDWQIDRDQLLEVKRMIATSGDFGPVIKRKTNPMKTTRAKRKPTPAQLAARERFAEMARSGGFKKAGGRKANPAPAGGTWLVHLVGKPQSWYATKGSKAAAVRMANMLNKQLGEIKYEVSEAEWSRKKNPDGMGSYGPFYGDTDAPLTEAQIERKAESYMDRLDRQLMRNEITQTVYDREVKALNKWAKDQYAKRRKTNPAAKAADYGYSVDMEGPGKSGLFVTKAVFKTAPDAKQYARALAKVYPSRTIRVMSGGRWLKKP